MSLIPFLQTLNGAQFLNATCVAAASGYFLWRALSPAAAIVPVTKIYASD